MSDLYHRYQHASHGELYAQLMAGNPDQVEGLAAEWRSMETTLNSLAQSLESDLDRLSGSWDSPSGAEFQRRVGLIASYARSIATDFGNTQRGLSKIAGPLAEAQAKAEHPDETDDYDKTLKGALTGGLVAGPGGLIVGGLWGHKQDQEEREKARQRMVRLVADLAANYELATAGSFRPEITPVPVGLPGTTTGTGVAVATAPRTGGVSAAPADRGGGNGGPDLKNVPLPAAVPPGPEAGGGTADQGMGSSPGGGGQGTSLAGAGGGGGVLGAAWAAGAAGLVAAAGGGARSSGPASPQLSAQPPNQSSLLGTGPAAAAPAGGRIGADTGRANAVPVRGTHPTVSGRTPDLGVRGGGGDAGRTGATAGRPTHGPVMNRGIGGANRGTGAAEDEQDSHLTWLTEDEMVWQGRENTPPPVLGTD